MTRIGSRCRALGQPQERAQEAGFRKSSARAPVPDIAKDLTSTIALLGALPATARTTRLAVFPKRFLVRSPLMASETHPPMPTRMARALRLE
mmetsp:Transcript_89447/g.289322  ORF Transcript_89447/g.289322 Transcript_89447/m.289322 type:complete len:92 (+) Transcript_89447:1243-1518(+)